MIITCLSLFRYYIRGPKRGHKERFLEGLPGFVDNIRPNGKGGFYVVIHAPDTEEVLEFEDLTECSMSYTTNTSQGLHCYLNLILQNPLLVRKLLALPSVRRLALRVQYFLTKLLEMIDSLSPNPITTWAYYYVIRHAHQVYYYDTLLMSS